MYLQIPHRTLLIHITKYKLMYQNFEVVCGKLNVLAENMGKNGSNVLSHYKHTVLANLVTLKKQKIQLL